MNETTSPAGPLSVTALPQEMIASIQHGTMRYRYKGIRTLKCPFDLALYHLVLERFKPKTIIEFGTRFGGSSLWFADMMANHGIQGHVYTFDIDLGSNVVRHERITAQYCDASEPEKYLSDDFMSSLPRPILLVEDASHLYQHVLAVLEFAHKWLALGDYIIVEDGILEHMKSRRHEGGPLRAIKEFVEHHPGEYAIDRELCDWFGTNSTWAIDGYIKPLRSRRE